MRERENRGVEVEHDGGSNLHKEDPPRHAPPNARQAPGDAEAARSGLASLDIADLEPCLVFDARWKD